MAEDLGPVVVDPHAFKRLWPALAVWLLLFITAGDAWTVVRRQLALAAGTPAEAVILGKGVRTVRALGRARRNYIDFSYERDGVRRKERQSVGTRGWGAVKTGECRPVHVLGDAVFLDDDLGYSRWKLVVFGAAFVALWAWAAARYRFG